MPSCFSEPRYLNTSLSTRGPSDGDVFSRIIDALRHEGYLILNEIFSIEQLQALFIDIKHMDRHRFHPAGIGREQEHQLNRFVRRDRICWLTADHAVAAFYLDWLEQLRQHLNRELFLGLFDYECHYAHYPRGAFYKKHLDAFQGSASRKLTTILYLNPAWQANDGGELILYAADGEAVLTTVQPAFGSLVIFLSEVFPHEVRPANKSRYSLTGWFRINTGTSIYPDPPR